MFIQDKREPALSDSDLMLFGRYKNLPLSEVPAHYLYWLRYESDIRQRDLRLANYIWNAQADSKHELGERWHGM